MELVRPASQADGADRALLLELAQGGDRAVFGQDRVEALWVVDEEDVEEVCPELSQAVLDAAHRSIIGKGVGIARVNGELGGQDPVLAPIALAKPVPEGLSDEPLAATRDVVVGRVDQVDS